MRRAVTRVCAIACLSLAPLPLWAGTLTVERTFAELAGDSSATIPITTSASGLIVVEANWQSTRKLLGQPAPVNVTLAVLNSSATQLARSTTTSSGSLGTRYTVSAADTRDWLILVSYDSRELTGTVRITYPHETAADSSGVAPTAAAPLDTQVEPCGDDGLDGNWGLQMLVPAKPGPVEVDVDVKTINRQPYHPSSLGFSGFELDVDLWFPMNDKAGSWDRLHGSDRGYKTKGIPPLRARFNLTADDVKNHSAIYAKVRHPDRLSSKLPPQWSGTCTYRYAGTGSVKASPPEVAKTTLTQTFACGHPKDTWQGPGRAAHELADDKVAFPFFADYPGRIVFELQHDYKATPDTFGRQLEERQMRVYLRTGNSVVSSSKQPGTPSVRLEYALTAGDRVRGHANWTVGATAEHDKVQFPSLSDKIERLSPKWKGICKLSVDVPFRADFSAVDALPDSNSARAFVLKAAYQYQPAGITTVGVPLSELDFTFHDLSGKDVSGEFKKRTGRTESDPLHVAGAAQAKPGIVLVPYDVVGVRPQGWITVRPNFNKLSKAQSWAEPTREWAYHTAFRVEIPPDESGAPVDTSAAGIAGTAERGVMGTDRVGPAPAPLQRTGHEPPVIAPVGTSPSPARALIEKAPPAGMPTAAPPADTGKPSCDGGCFDASASGGGHSATLGGHATVEIDDGEYFRLVLRSAGDEGHYVAFGRQPGGPPRAGTAYTLSNTCDEDNAANRPDGFSAEYVVHGYRDGEAEHYEARRGTLTIDSIGPTWLRGHFAFDGCRYTAEGETKQARVRGTFEGSWLSAH